MWWLGCKRKRTPRELSEVTYRTIGNTNIEWPDDEPLIWTMSEGFGEEGQRLTRSEHFDWTDLREIVDDDLLLMLKDELIDRRHAIALKSIKQESNWWKSLFRVIRTHNCYGKKLAQIDWQLLAALHTVHGHISRNSMDVLRSLFQRSMDSEIFSKGLQLRDFPRAAQKGNIGKKIDAILSTALARSTCVEVLARCHETYADGTMDIGLYSFANLAFTVYVRPESFRLIRLGDLKHNPETDKFGIWIYPAKNRVADPVKIYYDLPSTVGMLLLKQRMDVIDKYGHLVAEGAHQNLALFPARGLNKDNSAWKSEYSNENFGLLLDSGGIVAQYFYAIKAAVDLSIDLTATALRHTIGTQMALHGCSARTIQAVLKHANEKACRSYVDIAFHGLINELSEAMRPAFEHHFPVITTFRSKDEPLKSPANGILSEDIETGEAVFQGECGKQIRCEHAPFTCYGCNKFIPCFDADHEVNLKIVEKEIEDFSSAGQPYKVMVARWTRVKYEIQMVISACNLHQAQMQGGAP